MRYENGWIFADGRFVRGGFSVENGRFAHVLEDVPGPAEDLDGALVIPGLVLSYYTALAYVPTISAHVRAGRAGGPS